MSAADLKAHLTRSMACAPGHIVQAFAKATGARIEDLTGPSKTSAITQLRHELMFLMRDLTPLSQSDIGRWLGGRDMSTVHAGVARVADRVASDMDYRDRLRRLKAAILGAPVFYVSPSALSSAEMALRVALSVLTTPDVGDDEARRAAAGILSGYLSQAESDAVPQVHPEREAS